MCPLTPRKPFPPASSASLLFSDEAFYSWKALQCSNRDAIDGRKPITLYASLILHLIVCRLAPGVQPVWLRRSFCRGGTCFLLAFEVPWAGLRIKLTRDRCTGKSYLILCNCPRVTQNMRLKQQPADWDIYHPGLLKGIGVWGFWGWWRPIMGRRRLKMEVNGVCLVCGEWFSHDTSCLRIALFLLQNSLLLEISFISGSFLSQRENLSFILGSSGEVKSFPCIG